MSLTDPNREIEKRDSDRVELRVAGMDISHDRF